MPYTTGRGDYYTGDNYAAGGLSLKGLVKGISKAVVKVGGAVLSQTPAGRAFNLAKKVLQGASRPQIPTFAEPPIDYSMGGTDVDVPPSDVAGIPTFTDGRYIYDERGRRRGDTGRKGHFKKDGTWTNRARPRMNPTNFKALRRASRRAHSFLRIARSAVRYFTPKAPKGKSYVSFRKKAR